MARKLVESKRPVLIAVRDEKKGHGVASILGKQAGSPDYVQALQLDASDPESIERFISIINSKFKGQIHALINNAAIYPPDWNEGLFYEVKRLNFDGPVKLAKGIAPAIVKGGRIVNVTSGVGRIENLSKSYRSQVESAETLEDLKQIGYDGPDPGCRGWTPCYGVSKAMLNRASQIMAKMPEFRHVSVNSADPGWCRTDMGGDAAPRSPLQGRDAILDVLDLPEGKTGGVYFTT